jgi:hypothetical protein
MHPNVRYASLSGSTKFVVAKLTRRFEFCFSRAGQIITRWTSITVLVERIIGGRHWVTGQVGSHPCSGTFYCLLSAYRSKQIIESQIAHYAQFMKSTGFCASITNDDLTTTSPQPSNQKIPTSERSKSATRPL